MKFLFTPRKALGASTWDHTTERNDCTVRAAARALNLPYTEVHAAAANKGRKRWKGFNTRTLLSALNINTVSIDPATLVEQPSGASRYGALRYPTLTQIEPLLKRGRFILRIRGHVFAVIDGVQHDISINGARCRVQEIWEVL